MVRAAHAIHRRRETRGWPEPVLTSIGHPADGRPKATDRVKYSGIGAAITFVFGLGPAIPAFGIFLGPLFTFGGGLVGGAIGGYVAGPDDACPHGVAAGTTQGYRRGDDRDSGDRTVAPWAAPSGF